MTIRNNINAVKRRLLIELVDGGDFRKDVQRLSLAAVRTGQGAGKVAWEEYMSLFVDEGGNPKQLARLMATDGTAGQADMDDARAYLAADGACASATVTNFGVNVTEVLDTDL